MKRLFVVVICLLGISSGSLFAAGAGESVYFNGPTEYYYGTYYYSPNLQIRSGAPCFGCSSSQITSVYWHLSYSPQLTGQHAVLCALNIACVDITSSLTYGYTTQFNGLPDNTVFFIRYYVTGGSGVLPTPYPVCGYNNYIIVNYTY